MENFKELKELSGVIDLGLIDVDPEQPRKNKPVEYLRELGASIRERGLRNPIHVRMHPSIDGRYMLINGECRYLASVIAELGTIEARVFEYGENADGEIFLDQIMDNVVRKDMEPLEELRSYQTAIDKGVDIETLAKAFGKSVDLIEKDLPILKLPEALLKMYGKGNIPKAVARRIAELPTEARMLKAWEWARFGKNTDGMLKKIAAYVAESSQMSVLQKPEETPVDSKEIKQAKVLTGKLIKVIGEYGKSPLANGGGHLAIRVNSKNIDELAAIAKDMEKLGRKIMADVTSYKAASGKNAVA